MLLSLASIRSLEAQTNSIDQVIAANGGCRFVAARWEQELNRPDRTPFQKQAASWTSDDLQLLRGWIGRCLDPFSAAPGRREFVMRNVDARLQRFAEDQRRPQQPRLDPRDSQTRYAEAQNKIKAQYEASVAEKTAAYDAVLIRFNALALPYIEKTRDIDLDQLTALIADGPQVRAVRDELGSALYQLNTARALAEQGGVALQPFTRSAALDIVGFRLDKVEQLATRVRNCVPALTATGMPDHLVKARVLMLKGPSDPYLFEILCPPAGRAEFVRSGMLSKYPSLSFNGGAARLWFEVRDATGTAPNTKPDVRIVVRRVSTPRGVFEAATDLEAANLVEPLMAYGMLL